MLDYIDVVSGHVDAYNVMLYNTDWDPIENAASMFLSSSGKKDQLYEAIHISNSTKSPIF